MQYVEAHGARIPAIGFGTMTLKESVGVEMTTAALRAGYRHLDTAQMYGNEREVGEGLRASGVKREDVFITTKVWWDRLSAGDFEKSVEESLERLKLPSVDLLLIHWPGKTPVRESVASLNKVKQAGLTRHIGLANFTVPLLEEAVRASQAPLVTNQIEVHPFIDQSKVIAACRRHGISVTAYCPIARGKADGNAVLERIAKAHGKSAAQVSLRYLVQQSIIAIPRTSKPERLKENLDVFDFTLSDAEMAEIRKLKQSDGRVVSPPHAPQWDAA
jgi:2,5-diketo-D-gluconate reductase B